MAQAVDQKRITKQQIYKYIFNSNSPVSKPRLAEELALSLPTVYGNIKLLLQEGIIVKGEEQFSTGGRPPVAYVFNRERYFAVSIAISSMHLRFYGADALLNELGYKQMRLEGIDPEAIGKKISEELPIFLSEIGKSADDMIGLGITIPGVMGTDGNTLVLSPTLGLRDVSLKSMIEHINVSVPVIVANDSVSAGFAEKYALPFDERDKSFSYLFLEYGVGGSVYIEGKPFYGSNRRSGEFGHMKVGDRGLKCSCGKYDCLEAYIGAGRFSKALGITIEDFFGEISEGNAGYEELWMDGLRHLAIAINTIRMNFDCDIVLGGFMTEYLEPYIPFVKDELLKLDSFEDKPDYLHLGSFARRAGVIGLTNHLLMEHLEML